MFALQVVRWACLSVGGVLVLGFVAWACWRERVFALRVMCWAC